MSLGQFLADPTYPSYGVTMKQVWVKAATCSVTPATTCGAELPTLITAMPEPRSISELPSTSTSTPPPARSMNTGNVVPTPAETAALRAAKSSRERGPGNSVTIRRSCGNSVAIVGLSAVRDMRYSFVVASLVVHTSQSAAIDRGATCRMWRTFSAEMSNLSLQRAPSN